jgi:hypothetical protein
MDPSGITDAKSTDVSAQASTNIEQGSVPDSPQRRATLGMLNVPQHAPGASAAIGHNVENSIPLSIFPIATDKFW